MALTVISHWNFKTKGPSDANFAHPVAYYKKRQNNCWCRSNNLEPQVNVYKNINSVQSLQSWRQATQILNTRTEDRHNLKLEHMYER